LGGGGAEKKKFRYANLPPPYLYLTPPTFQILEISLCGLEQRAVDDAIDQWRRRLLAYVDVEGGHSEHNLGL